MNTPTPRRAKRTTTIPLTPSEINKARYAQRKAAGLIKPKTEAAKKWRPSTPEQLAKKRAREIRRNEVLKEKRREAREVRKAASDEKRADRQREKRRIAKEARGADFVDKRTSPYRAKKAVPTPKQAAPQAKPKLPKQAAKIRITSIPVSERTPLYIPEIRATVYVRPGRSIDEVREQYLGTRLSTGGRLK